MLSTFENGKINDLEVVASLSAHLAPANPDADPHLRAAKAVSTATSMYKRISHSTIDVRVLQRGLYRSRWVKSASKRSAHLNSKLETSIPPSLRPYEIDRASAFACIKMFESGYYDPDPSDLDMVMAMASGDSIYAATTLLSGPSQESVGGDIKRVRGGIGRPGISYLVPPSDPLIRKVAISEWPRISRDEFDGCIGDCFQSTSLHLSFTGAESRLNLGFSGAQDNEVLILEALISVHENGRWVADLNLLKSFNDKYLLRLLPHCDRHDHSSDSRPIQQFLSGGQPIPCINNWLELIDTPESPCSIVQAHANWEARLAATSIGVARGNHTYVMSRQTCWQCLEDAVTKSIQPHKFIIIA